MDPVEAECVESLVHPLGGVLGLPPGLAVDATACVSGARVLQAAGVGGGDRGEPFGAPVGLVQYAAMWPPNAPAAAVQ